MLINRYFFSALTIALVLLSGCATFKQNEIAQVDALPDVSQYQNKPSVFVDFQFFRGEPGSDEAKVVPPARKQMQPVIEEALRDSALFESYTFDEQEKENTDYTIRINVYNHGNAGAAAALGFISGFTFGVIPAAATDNYTVTAEALDRQGEVISKLQNKDSVTTWIGLWFIPMMGNTPKQAASDTLENQVHDLLKTLVENKTLQYSLMRMLRHTPQA